MMVENKPMVRYKDSFVGFRVSEKEAKKLTYLSEANLESRSSLLRKYINDSYEELMKYD